MASVPPPTPTVSNPDMGGKEVHSESVSGSSLHEAIRECDLELVEAVVRLQPGPLGA